MARADVERASRPVLLRLHALPRFIIPAGTILLIVIGALAPTPVAVVALVVLLAFVGWISYLSWPVITGGGKAMRVIMMVLIVGIGLSHLLF